MRASRFDILLSISCPEATASEGCVPAIPSPPQASKRRQAAQIHFREGAGSSMMGKFLNQKLSDTQVGRIRLFFNVRKRHHLEWFASGAHLPGSPVQPFGRQQVRTGQRQLSIRDRKQHERPEEKRHGLWMLWVDGLEPRPRWQIQFDAVAGIPLALNGRKCSRSYLSLQTATVYRNRRSLCPRRNPEIQSEIPDSRGLHVELHHVVKR